METEKSKYAGMNDSQIRRAADAERAAFEATTRSDGYLIADLRKAFDRVCDRSHWKNPVNFLVGNTVLKQWEKEDGITLDMIEESIVFFQGVVPKVNQNINFAHIKSQGYIG